MIAIIDYDAGNIKSVEKAFMYLNQEVVVTRDHDTIMKADKAVLPGVGCSNRAKNLKVLKDLVFSRAGLRNLI